VRAGDQESEHGGHAEARNSTTTRFLQPPDEQTTASFEFFSHKNRKILTQKQTKIQPKLAAKH